MTTSFIILGSGQDGGAPQVGLSSSLSAPRTASCVAVIGPQGAVVLLDVTPDLRLQSQALLASDRYPQARETFIDGVFITHAHMGHYAGLLQFGKEAAASDHLPLFGTERFLGYIGSNEPWAALLRDGHLEPIAIDDSTATIDVDVAIEAIPVPHRDEFSDTVAFSVSVKGHPCLLYLPDIDAWDQWDAANDEISRHDIALVDATFSSADELPGRDMASIGHPTVPTTIDRFADLTAETHIILSHINHSNPLGHEHSDITQQAIDAGFTIAYDGLTLDVDH
jgi:pyrroloquinoline quinone biosynthesis protein B